MIKPLLCAGWLLVFTSAGAEVWQAGADSTLKFSAVQQGARFEGGFARFSTQIEFDPAEPAAGRISATIDLDSVDTQNPERDDYLREAEWLHIVRWPQARFAADRIRPDGNGYIADGELTLRGVTRPVALRFDWTPTGTGARFTGSADLLRLDFGVGSGDWTDTRWVKNEVQVSVDLQLQPVGTESGPEGPR